MSTTTTMTEADRAAEIGILIHQIQTVARKAGEYSLGSEFFGVIERLAGAALELGGDVDMPLLNLEQGRAAK